MGFSETLRKLRTEQGLSQQKLAKLSGISQTAIYHWEKGDRNPKLEQVRRIADALEVSLSELEPEWGTFSNDEWKIDFVIGADTSAKNRAEAHLMKNYWKLNNDGQKKVRDYTKDLTKIPEYRKKTDELPQEPEPDNSHTPK